MQTIEDLVYLEKFDLHTNAWTFAHDNAEHVAKALKGVHTAVAPSGSDMMRPELWKGIHWKWFREVFVPSFRVLNVPLKIKA